MITNFKINKTTIVLFTIFLTLLFFLIYFIIAKSNVKNKIYPHVYIDNNNVGYKTKQEILKMYQNKNKQLNYTLLTIIYKNEPIGTFSAELLNLHYNTDEIYEKAYLVGRSTHNPSRYLQQIYTIFNLNKYEFNTQIEYDRPVIEEFLDNIKNSYNVLPKNALFKFEKTRVTQFSEPKNGLKILDTQFLFAVRENIRKLKTNFNDNITINLNDEVLKPSVTLAGANTYGIEELIGVGQSDFTHSIPERIFNLTLATSKFNGVIIPRNTIFSFAETVGDISRLTGYKPAYIIKGGRTVLGDGGGVCQVSTTLFRAALNTGLPIIEQHPHAYRVSYYENDGKPGFDATIFAPSVDLKFKNNTLSNILIQTEIDTENNLLFFKLYGKGDNRKIDISPVTLFDVQPPPPPMFQEDPSLQKGITRQVDFPAWGGKTTFDYKVSLNGQMLFEKKFFSNYRPWQAVFLVGTKE